MGFQTDYRFLTISYKAIYNYFVFFSRRVGTLRIDIAKYYDVFEFFFFLLEQSAFRPEIFPARRKYSTNIRNILTFLEQLPYRCLKLSSIFFVSNADSTHCNLFLSAFQVQTYDKEMLKIRKFIEQLSTVRIPPERIGIFLSSMFIRHIKNVRTLNPSVRRPMFY